MDNSIWNSFVQIIKKCAEIVWISNIVYTTSSVMIVMAMKSLKKLAEQQLNSNIHNKVLFFPDHEYYCRCMVLEKKSTCSCKEGESSFKSLLKIIENAKQSIDICMFVLSSHELADAVLKLHKKGIIVRVVTDVEKMEIVSSQIMNFRAAGIQVRNDKSAFLMHHKFAIIDNEMLITGSFNWTHQAVTGNKENVLTTSYEPIVQPYKDEFERLWKEYDPEIKKN